VLLISGTGTHLLGRQREEKKRKRAEVNTIERKGEEESCVRTSRLSDAHPLSARSIGKREEGTGRLAFEDREGKREIEHGVIFPIRFPRSFS